MYALTVLSALAAGLFSTASAAPTPQVAGVPQEYYWNVTGWSAGCARAGCYYDFNVTGAIDGIRPGFLAYCSGDDVGYFKDCKLLSGVSTSGIPTVAAELATANLSNPDGIAKLGVSLSFTDADTLVTYNYTGHANATYNQFVAPLENFPVKPDTVTAVA